MSTTGFAPPAVDFASTAGIELRSVTSATKESISDWFSVTTLDFVNHIGDLTNAKLIISPQTDSKIFSKAIKSIKGVAADNLILIHSGTGAMLHVKDAWQDVINQFQELFDGINPGEDPITKTIDVNYTSPKNRYKLKIDDYELEIEGITYKANLSTEISHIPISQITKYKNILEAGTIADSIHFEIPTGFDLAIHKVGNKSDSHIALTLAPIKKGD